jgi:hypothetical protein|uniref:Uncharacterized protein n=1 Tax=Prymnesium polylepis TaxID=72548 RepID=A0A6T7WVY3_9EUKA|mmetsp:Transcript_14310/g.36299  ORF Transcript_14310/g.36299 Transcript_14310/m.36299 type:complete len:111 (+) Transcript_14310:113-445(+)|eukprot:6891006-Prymnesium_polylepis.2
MTILQSGISGGAGAFIRKGDASGWLEAIAMHYHVSQPALLQILREAAGPIFETWANVLTEAEHLTLAESVTDLRLADERLRVEAAQAWSSAAPFSVNLAASVLHHAAVKC